jgi:hypothetical protein
MITKHEVVKVDKKYAEKLLSINTKNFRNLNHAYARLLAEDMNKKKWHVNGESLKVSSDNKFLLDGQNRCQALLYSTAEFFESLMVWTDDDKGIDKGRARTLANYLSNLGISSATTVAAVIRLSMGYESRGTFPSGGFKITDDEGLTFWAKRNKQAFDFGMSVASRVTNMNVGSRNVWGAIGCEVGKNPDNHDKFTHYVDYVLGRGGRTAGDTTDNVRLVIDDMVLSAAPSRGVISFDVLGSTIANGWNAFLLGKHLSKVKAKTKAFPTIIVNIGK